MKMNYISVVSTAAPGRIWPANRIFTARELSQYCFNVVCSIGGGTEGAARA